MSKGLLRLAHYKSRKRNESQDDTEGIGSGNRSSVDGDKQTYSRGAARLLPGCFGRSDRSAQGGGESSSICCVGRRVTIKINGTTTLDDHFPEIHVEGIIAWKLRGDYPGVEVTFRKMQFRDLSR